MKLPLYFDYAATTPVDPQVAEKMVECLTFDGNFANPASRSHVYGWRAEQAVERARRQVANLVGADPREIVWTSGATESNNLAIKGVAEFHGDKGRHIITSAIEHKAVLDTCKHLEERGYEVTYLQPTAEGLITVESVAKALRPDTILVSLMQVNNELGTVTDIEAIGQLTRDAGVLFHVDAAQSAGKLPIDLNHTLVDLMSFSAHKVYGPKGIGALYVRRQPKVRIAAQIHGGGHEQGMRSGTLATHQIVGMGEAFEIAGQVLAEETARIQELRNRLWEGVQDLPGVQLNGALEPRVCGILNIAFTGVEGESMMMALKDLAISSGSACTSASVEPSYVLTGIGLSRELAHSSLRFSLGRYTTAEEIEAAIGQVRQAVRRLRNVA